MKQKSRELSRSGILARVPIGQIRPHARNSRVHDDRQVAALEKIVRRFGYLAPVASAGLSRASTIVGMSIITDL